MPWFESSKEKELRLLVQDKMRICLTRPKDYQSAFAILDSYTRKPNQNVIEMIVDHIKEVIKDDDKDAKEKYQAMVLLRDLMQSHSKALGKYVCKKILKRLTIYAEHKKNSKDENRGKDIFSKIQRQPEYASKFLNTLLLAIEEWGTKWPRSVDGPHQEFHNAYNELLMEKSVQFPMKAKQVSKPKTFRNSKQEKSPAKITNVLSPKNIEHTPTQPVIKPKSPLPQNISNHFSSIIDILTIFSEMLSENQQFNDMWPIIKETISQLKSVIQEGNGVMAQIMENEGDEDNQQILEKIQVHFQLIESLDKDVGIVDRKNEKYSLFNSKYVKKCKRIIASLEKDLEGSKKGNFSGSVNKTEVSQSIAVDTSLAKKVEEVEKPRVPQRNKYDSTNDLKRQIQLNMNQIKKEDFNSNNHNHTQGSESSRYNSKTGNIEKVNRNSDNSNRVSPEPKKSTESNPQKQESEKEASVSIEKQKNISPKVEEEPKQPKNTFSKIEEKRKEQTGISKISQKNNESQSQLPGSGFEFDAEFGGNEDFSGHQANMKKGKVSNNDSFSNFQVPQKEDNNSDSNSDFFNQIEKKENKQQNPMVNPRKNRRPLQTEKKFHSEENFFEVSVPSKIGSDHLEGFDKQKSNSKSFSKSKGQSKEISRNQLGFDTFKSPNEISKAFEELRKSQKSHSSSQSSGNPFEDHFNKQNSRKSSKNEDNIFGSNYDPNSFVKKQSNPFETSQRREDDEENPFTEGKSPFESNGSGSVNPFESKLKMGGERDNPFDSKVVTEENQNIFSSQYQGNNPFASKVNTEEAQSAKFYTGRSQDNSSHKSERSNPFSEKKSDQNSQSSNRERPPIPSKKKPEAQNPFEQTQQSAQNSNPFEKETEKAEFENSQISNPFQKANPFETSNNFFDKKSSKSSSSQKSISQRGSFKNVANAETVNRNNNSMDDPFAENNFFDPSSADMKKKAPQVKQNERSQNTRKISIEKSQGFNGFDFDDFNNVSQSNTGENKRESMKKDDQSGFNFEDFGDVRNSQQQRSSLEEKNFFNSQQMKKSQEKQKKKEEFFFDDFGKRSNNSSKKSEKDSFNNFFQEKNHKDNNNESQKEISVRESKKMQFNFDDFDNFSQSAKERRQSVSSQISNPFDGFQPAKKTSGEVKQQKKSLDVNQKQEGYEWDNFGNISEKVSHHQDSKIFIEEPKNQDSDSNQIILKNQQSSDANNQYFDDKFDLLPSISEERSKEIKITHPVQEYPKYDQPIESYRTNRDEKESISLHIEEISPFQKKQIKWDVTLGAIPSATHRYNISEQELCRKKKSLDMIVQQNQEKLERYQNLKSQMESLKKQHISDLDQVIDARNQKREFGMILKKIKQSNQMKEKHIEEMIKKIKHANDIKSKILEKERLLFDRIKSDQQFIEKRSKDMKSAGNKFERFNQNINQLKQNDLNFTKSYQSNYSVYYSRAY